MWNILLFKNLIRIKNEMIVKAGSAQAAITRLEPWSGLKGLHVKSVYEWLRPRATPRPCFRSIWHSIHTPKHSFMVWLATLERLPTKDRMNLSDGDLMCVLCQAASETHAHLFFDCAVGRGIWENIRQWLHINRRFTTIRSGLKWVKKDVHGTSWLSRARRLAFQSLVYITWTSRNKILKERIVLTEQMIVTQIQLHVYQSLYVKFPEFERYVTLGLRQGS